jgi:hypothetical protein
MRTIAFVSLVSGIILAVAASSPACASAEERPAPLSLSYTYAGLTEITVADGKLHYVWHTLRWHDETGPGPLSLQSLEGYDRHQIDVWLTDNELAKFSAWVARHKVFEFARHFPPTAGESSHRAYRSSLNVVQGDEKQSLAWEQKTPKEVDTAISELISIAEGIESSRRK